VGPHAGIFIHNQTKLINLNHCLGGSPWSGMVGPHGQEYTHVVNKKLVAIDIDIKKARDTHNQFLTELNLPTI